MPGLLSGSESTRGFRRIAVLLWSLNAVPTALLLALGILMLIFYETQLNVLFGILVVTLVACLLTGTVLLFVFLRKEANLSRLQTDFVSKVSHELRTPLTSIGMFVETLQSKRITNPEEVDACLDVLQRETSRLTERIERLLDWGRMEAGKQVYSRRPDAVEPIVSEAIRTFDVASLGRKVEVAVDVAPNLPLVFVDRSALVDALVNLLSNGYKYTGENKQLELSVRKDGERVRFTVSDNGIGIPRREHRRIFEKFYRVDEWLSREVEGSGLGLAIVRHVVKAHDGWIELESEPGKGSKFTILIPTVA